MRFKTRVIKCKQGFQSTIKTKSMNQIKNISLASLVVLLAATGCDKTKPYEIKTAEPEAHFVGAKNQTYSVVVNPAPAYKVYLGTTNVATSDRTITVNITSPTGATAGNQYTLSGLGAGNTITIKAGQAIDSILVTANFSSYTAGRRDTLVFTIKEPSLKSSSFLDTVKLALRGPCFEGDVTLNNLRGNYANTRETFGASNYGPYLTTIPTVTATTLTTGSIVVTNIFDDGWGPLTFNLDWTDPLNRTATVVAQNAITPSNAGALNGAYAGQTVAVRPFAGQPGTFSACNSTFTLRMQLGVTGVGFFGSLYTVNMAR
jgi:hypothetical protein